MVRILLALDRIVRFAVITALTFASVLLFLMAVLGAADVAVINILGYSIPIVSELSADALAVVIFLSVAAAQQGRQHVSVELFTHHLPHSLQTLLSFIALFVTVVFFAMLTWCTWLLAQESWQLQQSAMALIPYPIYPFKIAVLVGIFLATLEAARQTIWHLLGGERPTQAGEVAI